MPFDVEHATEDDIPSWLDLADEVGQLFGADMAADPEYRQWLLKNVVRESAYCIHIDGELAGAMQFRNDQINWLAVGKKFQRRGVGQVLVEYAITHCDNGVRVITFGKNHPHPDSDAAQALYTKAGFDLADATTEDASDGTSRSLYIWRKQT